MRYINNTRRWSRFVLAGLVISLVAPLLSTAAAAAATSCSWTDANTVTCNGEAFTNSNISGNPVTLTGNPNNDGTNGVQCGSDTLVISNYQNATSAKMTTIVATQTGKYGNSCTPTTTTVTLTNTYASVQSQNNTNGSSNTQSPQLVCTLSLFNPLTWLICPLVSAAQGAIEGLTAGIDSLLTINTNEIFANTNQKGSTGAGFYQAWNTFRIFAAGLIVIAGLIMLIAQASGSDVIDAYTIHKVLPRILIAVIFITLSWPLLNFAITLTNDLGTGIRAIIYTPFNSIGTTVRVDGGTATVGALVGTATFLTLGLLGIASFMLTALLAVFVGFVVLFLRQVVVMMLVIFAPLAIACYVLPGTQKAWNFWKDTFLSMLIVFPIISALIAMGRVFAVVMYNNRTAGVPTFVNEIGAFIVYFLPYFLLPAAFRWAGGAMATIGGFVNDRHRGAFDRLKNLRKTQSANNLHAMKTGNRFKSDNPFANRFNATTRGIATLPSAGYNPAKMRSRFQAGMSKGKEEELKEYMEKNGAFASIRGNDDYLQATMANMAARDRKTGKLLRDSNGNTIKGGTNESDWRRYLGAMGYEGRDLEQGVAAIRDAKRSTSNDVFGQAAVIANASTGTGWKDGGVTEMMESINDAFGDDRHGATNALAQMRGMASQSGRLDLAGMSFGQQAQALGEMHREKSATGEVSAGTKKAVKTKLHESILETKGANEFARARGNAVKQIAPEMLKDLKKADRRAKNAAADAAAAPGDAKAAAKHARAQRALAQKYASLANFHDSLNHMAPENAKFISDGVLAQEIDGVSVFDHIDNYRKANNRDFLETRKDYDARRYAEEGARQGAQPPDAP